MKNSKPKAKVKATGYWSLYQCGCISRTYKHLRSVPRTCRIHHWGYTRSCHQEFGSPNLNFSK